MGGGGGGGLFEGGRLGTEQLPGLTTVQVAFVLVKK